MAVDLGHCDSVRCAHAGEDCATAVGFLAEDQMSNMTYRQAQEKWSYLCISARSRLSWHKLLCIFYEILR